MKQHPVGSSLILVASLHSAVALWRFGPTLSGMVQEGLFNTVRTGAIRAALVEDVAWRANLVMVERAFATWYVIYGVLTFLLGLAVTALERRGDEIPASLVASLGTFAAVAIAVEPMSGAWLLLIPVGIVCYRRARAHIIPKPPSRS